MSDLQSLSLISRMRSLLPELSDTDAVHVLPVSGGADSSALAVLLTRIAPEISFRYLFTDTGSEDPSVYASLDRLEQYLGIRIERIAAAKNLVQLVEQYNGFLPSARERWCTRALKLEPFKTWLKQFAGQRMKMYVGIRADEDRLAFTSSEIDTVMPFVSLGMKREQVFALLSETVGVPALYKHRSRSGCGVCPYMRQHEVVSLMTVAPVVFHQGRSMEKLVTEDEALHAVLPEPYWQTSGLARNWLGFPQPAWGQSTRGASHAPGLARRREASLFEPDRQGLWVAVEFWVHDSYLEPVVWRQELVSVSTSHAGLQRQIDLHAQHRLASAEVWFLTQEEMQRELRYVLYYIEVDAEVLQVGRPSKASYTWQQGHSFARTEHLVKWAQAALWSKEEGVMPRTATGSAVGVELLAIEPYQPKAPDVEDVYDERYVACPMCAM